jgi:aquaporin Z
VIASMRGHWPEYLIEAGGLGFFMISASLFGVAIEHPASPVRAAITDPLARRALMGAAMGLTAMAIIHSPWGKRSGAHINPAVTLTFWTLGKVKGPDALFYALFQFAGAAAGMAVAGLLLGGTLGHPAVAFVKTVPGPGGAGAAFAAELAISFLLMTAILTASNAPSLMRWTGLFAGCLVASFITFEAPLSGMSMNPARTFGSAWAASSWEAWWVYASAPVVGMLAAAFFHSALRRIPVRCAKLVHPAGGPCIFRCGFAMAPRTAPAPAGVRQGPIPRTSSARRTS